MNFCDLLMLACSHQWKVISCIGLRAPKKRMSRDSLVSSMPTDGWSCGTLEEGVAKCASMAGIRLRPEDAAEASKSKSVGQGVKKGR